MTINDGDILHNLKDDNASVYTKYSINSNKYIGDLDHFFDDIVESSMDIALEIHMKLKLSKLINVYCANKFFSSKDITTILKKTKPCSRKKKGKYYEYALDQNEKNELKSQHSIKIELFLKDIFLDVSKYVFNHNLKFLKNVMIIQRFFAKLKEKHKRNLEVNKDKTVVK